jgi:flagellar hook-length control protein FliK
MSQDAAGEVTASSPVQPGFTQTPGTSTPNAGAQNQSAPQTTLSSPSAHAAAAPFQNLAATAPASDGSDTPNSTAELTGPAPAAANQAQAANAQSATQTATEAPAQAATASTTAQASLDAAMSTNLEAGAGVGASPNAGSSQLSLSAVPMQEMIDSIGATIELASRQGIAKARIELQPEELGHISIRLSQTNEGLRARVTADTPAGAQALSQGRSELRQSLSSLGLSLLQLDIGSSGQPGTGEEDGRFAGNADGSNALGATGTAEENEALAESRDDTRPAGTPRGEIVDVLA